MRILEVDAMCMARPADQQGSALSRVVFEALDGMWQLTVLCAGCLSGVTASDKHSRNVRYKVRPYGKGPGSCEFCAHEIRSEVGL